MATLVFWGLRVAMMANEYEVEVGCAHLSKTATGGAAFSVAAAQVPAPKSNFLS